MRSRALAWWVSTLHRLALAEHDPEKQSGTVPKYDPAIRFYQHAGATIAHQQTQAYPAMLGCFGQVNNM